jgi:uncharacterized surface protein with fasciclin (FAS1) repeats
MMKKINQIYSKSNLIKIFITILIPFLFSNCEVQEDFKYVYDNPGGKLDISAWEFIQQTESLSMMEEAVIAAGLQGLYSGSTAKTFIVPENKGFIAYLKTKGVATISALPVSVLTDDLKYHIVKATVNFADPALLQSNNAIAYQTENGKTMFLSHNTSYQGVINQGTKKSWTILTSNIEPTNGVIHITDALVYLQQ